MKAALAISALLATVSAKIRLVTNSSDHLYFDNEQSEQTMGYSFSLYQNVLSVELNATANEKDNDRTRPAALIIMPNLMLEFNDTIAANDTTDVYGFLSKANANANWGKGLTATKHDADGSEVWEIEAQWKNPEGGRPRFAAFMYLSSEEINYQNMTLGPHSIMLKYSILDYPFKMTNGTLGFDQITLGQSVNRTASSDGNNTSSNRGTVWSNGTIVNLTSEHTENDIFNLRVNTTALVDGKPQTVFVGALNSTTEELSIMAGNSTRVNVTDYEVGSVFLGFAHSDKAKNVTFYQRMGLNVTVLRGQNNTEAQNAGISLEYNMFTLVIALLGSMFVALPALVF